MTFSVSLPPFTVIPVPFTGILTAFSGILQTSLNLCHAEHGVNNGNIMHRRTKLLIALQLIIQTINSIEGLVLQFVAFLNV